MGFVRAIMITVRAEIFAPNDSILYRGNKDSELAVVVRGMAGMVANEGLEIIHYFQAGFCIGEEAFLSPHTPVEHSVVALTYSNVFLFTRQNFEAVLGYYPTFKEYIYETFQREEIEEIARRKEEQSAAEDAARTGRRKKKKKPARDQSSASSISRPQLSQLLNTNIHRKNGSISNKKNRKASSALDRMHSSKFIKRAIFTAEAKAEKSKDAIDTRKEVKTLASHMSLPAIVNMSKKASRAKKRLIRSLTLAQRRKLQSTASLASSARSLVKWSESTGDGASLASFLPSSPLTPPLPPPPSPPLFTPPSSVPPSIPPETITAQNLDLSTLLSDAGPIVCISSEVDPSSSSPPCLPGIVPMCNGKRSSALNDKNQTKLLHKIDCEAPFREAQNVNNGSVVQISSVSANSHTCLSSEAEKEQAIEMVQVTADSGVVQKDVKREESNGNNGDDDDDYVENKKTKAVSVEVSSTNSVGFVLQNIANSYNATVEKKEGAASKYRVKSNEVESKSTEKLVLKDSVKKRRAFVREAMRRSRMSRDEENRRDHFELLRRMISDTMYESMIAEPYWLALYLIGTSFYLVSIPSRLAWLQVEDSPNDTDTTWVLLAFGWTIDIFFVVDTCLKASLLYEVRGLETRIIDDQRQLEGRMGDNDVPRWYSIFVGIVASFPCDIIVLLVDVAGGHSVDLGRVYLYRLNRLVRVERLGFLISEIVLRVAPKIKLGTLFEAEDSDEEFDHDDEEEGRNDDGDVRSTLREAEHEYKSLVDICIPMIYGIFFMHVTACFWLALASWLASGGGISWLEDEDENNTFRYVRSLCWILVTAFTVGYGDIVAESHYEVILQMVIILSATNAFICLLAWLNAQAENSTQQEAEWEQRLEIVNKFMKVRQIPIHLRERVDAYHRYMWSVQKGKTDEELMEQIPPHTRVNLLSALVRRTFHKMPVFKGCESGFIDTCILLLHLRTYSPGDFLYYSGDYFDEVIFIYQGVVTILSQNLQDVVDVVGPGSVVGEQCLTESTKSVKNYCAESFVQTAIMSVGAFQWAIEKYPKILEEVDRQRALLAAKRQWFSMNSDTGSESLATAVSVEKAQVDLKTAVENAKRKKDILRRKEQQQSIRIFKPTSKVCIYWNLASMVMLSLYGFIIPLRLAFPLDGLRMTLYYMDSFIDLFFVVDMIFRFRYFARISNGVLIEDRTEIGEHYLRQEFKYDLFGTLVIDTLLVFLSFDVVAFLRLFRMMHVHRLSEYFDTLEGFIRTNANISLYIIRLMKQMLILLGFIHWAACCWHYIAEQENASNSWVNAQETLVSRSVDSFSRYLQSVYFVIVTTATVGFGDIKPKTEIETFFGVCLIGIGCIQYGTAAANVASIASNSDITASSFNRKLQTVTDFIRKKDMPSDLGDSLVHFYSNLWETHKGVDENSTLDWMPLPLRRDLCTTWYGKYVFNFPLFRNLPTVFAVRAAVAMNVQSYVVGELLVERNSGADSLFIVFEGKGVMEDEMGRPFCRMPPGSSFGMENLRFRRPRLQQFTVRALRNTSVLLFDNAILEELCNLYGLEFRQKLFRRIDELMILEEKKAKAYKVLTAFVGYSIQRRRSRRLFGRSLSLAKDKSVKGSNAVTRIRTMPHTKTNKADADIVEKKSEDDYNGNIIDEEPNNGALLRLCVWLMTFVISPGSIFFKVWSSLRLCGDFFYVITTPIIIAFRMYPLGELSTLSAATIGIWSVGWTFDMFFGIDLYLRMHRILDREAIISQSDDSFVDAFTVWRRFWKCRRIPAILYDFVLVFPFDIIILVFMRGSDPDEIVFARLNRILYMFSMSENMKIIDLWIETFTTVDVSFHGRKLIAIFVYSLTFLHITACLWKAVGDPHFRYVHGNTRTWYQLQPEMETGSGLKQYLICLYFSIVTFTTTGYGEITPTTKFEVVFTVLVIFVGNVISAAFIGNVSAIAAKVTEEDHVYQKQIENLHHYMRSRNVRKTLRDRFHEYFEYIHENDTLIDDFKTFALLPYHLRKRTKHYLYGPYLEGLDFLSKDSKFFLQLADCLRPQIYLKDDIVVKKGDIGLELYVVVQGECQRVPVSEEVHGDMVDLKANRNNLGVYSPSNSVKRDYKNARKTSIAGLGQGSFERKKSRVSSNFGMASGATATHSSPSSTLSRMMRPHRSITIQHTGETSPPLRVGSPSMSVSWKSGAESTSFPSPTAAPSILMKGFQFGKHSETVTSGLDEQVVQGLLIRTNDNGAKEKIVGAEKDSDACGMKGEGTGTQMPYADDEDFPVMEAGDFFGDIAFVTASTRTCSVKALSSCQLLVLDRNDWDELMVAFPKVERICTLSFRRIWRTKWRYKVKMESDGGRTLDCMYEEMLAYEALEARREKVLYNITKLWKTGILANR